MAVARNADGRMEVFARGIDPDRALIHIWQLGPNTGWAHEWSSLGGSLRSVPAVGRHADGRLAVFAVGGNNSIWHISQTAANNGWSPWVDLSVGGLVLLVAPVVATNADGRLEVFSIMVPSDVNEGTLFHNFQNAPSSAGFAGWESLGRPSIAKDAPTAGLVRPGWDPDFPQFDVGRNADGRLEAFAVTRGGVLWHTWQLTPNSRRPWSPWAPLESPPGLVLDKAPVVALNSGGQLEVFSRGPGGRVWHRWQGGPIDGWSAWDDLGGALTSAPAVSRNADGRLEVFGRGPDTRIWHKWQVTIGWSDWEPLGNDWAPGALGSGTDTDGFPTVGQNADGRLQVFVKVPSLMIPPGFRVAHTYQGGSFGGWSEWLQLGMSWRVHTGGAFGRG
jgi:hypothetical protein